MVAIALSVDKEKAPDEYFRCPSCMLESESFSDMKHHVLSTGHIYIPENMSKLKVPEPFLLPPLSLPRASLSLCRTQALSSTPCF